MGKGDIRQHRFCRRIQKRWKRFLFHLKSNDDEVAATHWVGEGSDPKLLEYATTPPLLLPLNENKG